ncbi:hypothetical protein VULLAG_LOCUS21777 [Vulpes lagopus]
MGSSYSLHLRVFCTRPQPGLAQSVQCGGRRSSLGPDDLTVLPASEAETEPCSGSLCALSGSPNPLGGERHSTVFTSLFGRWKAFACHETPRLQPSCPNPRKHICGADDPHAPSLWHVQFLATRGNNLELLFLLCLSGDNVSSSASHVTRSVGELGNPVWPWKCVDHVRGAA